MAVKDSANTLGFLAAVSHEPLGVMGGYLVLNAAGRPLEFHCTTPVKTSRAQQILYGPTLDSFLYGELIGATLVQKSEQTPLAVFVEQSVLLTVREHIALPTALVAESAHDASATAGIEASYANQWAVGGNLLAVLPQWSSDQSLITQRLAELSEVIDLAEPFGRIREAIDEAYRSTKAA